jgi:hypothetical protein
MPAARTSCSSAAARRSSRMNIIIHVRGLPALLREEIGRRVAQQSEGMVGSFVMSAFDRKPE